MSKYVMCFCLCTVLAQVATAADNYYFVGEDSITVTASDDFIAVQFDSMTIIPGTSTFIANHPCLSGPAEDRYLDRGFYIFALSPTCGYSLAAGDLMADPTVYRVAPVYLTEDSAEFCITDLVSVQFERTLAWDSVHAILAAYNLAIVESTLIAPNLVLAELEDTLSGGPLEIGNDLEKLDETQWACATFCNKIIPAYTPVDSFFHYQYNFNNWGQTGGTTDADIDADLAWDIANSFGDSNIIVAVLDQGVTWHEDLPSSRITNGIDVVGDSVKAPQIDYDPSPGNLINHGMMCAGLIAASHNDTGIAGLAPNVKIMPIKIFDDAGYAPTPPEQHVWRPAYAIRWADTNNATILSNSWTFGSAKAIPDVMWAIQEMISAEDDSLSEVIVFAAGNDDKEYVYFPANMPEVISVGATDKNDAAWYWSNCGDSLDVMAPTGDRYVASGDVWTIDQMWLKGWNPYITGGDDAEGNAHYTGKGGGTSAACPQVAGIAAMILSRRPDFYTDPKYRDTCSQVVRNVIEGSAEDLGDPGWDPLYGHGRANAYRALLSVIRGDVDNDGMLTPLDVTLLVKCVYKAQCALEPERCVGDCNCDGALSPLDTTYLIKAVYLGL
ncbi:MAG: S8 family serine peptidase, partial [Planctomycetota bacterium]